ncbi:Hypothetical protein SRAE_2000494200 [Strongyloides ratti]|uniref:Uncharacterized protein n=1 Tax=Strongyloides ratti TaxID=34506 RepID=A0A090LQ67_STRRB|nr:Hypothetical protein SRAE_2000494200 [Strongyloides ratti]CEF70309.1 Hypothetical protein SRAE_2000494200 [Strongyloides ratti]
MIIQRLTFIESCIGVGLNLLVFVMFSYNNSTKKDNYFLFLKWTRLIDVLIPFTSGVMTNGFSLTPMNGSASDTVCFWLKSPMLCNYMIISSLIVVLANNILRKLSYMFRYNIFVLKKSTFYCSKFEKYFTILGLIIMPIIFLSYTHTFPLKPDEYEKYYNNIDKVLQKIPNTSYIISLYNPKISLNNSIVIFFSIGCIYLGITIAIMIFWYAIPLEKQLKSCKKNGFNETNKKIIKAIFYLRISIILPVFCSLLPTFFVYIYSMLTKDTLANGLSLGFYLPLIYQTYSIINPIVIMFQGQLLKIKNNNKVTSVKKINIFLINKLGM